MTVSRFRLEGIRYGTCDTGKTRVDECRRMATPSVEESTPASITPPATRGAYEYIGAERRGTDRGQAGETGTKTWRVGVRGGELHQADQTSYLLTLCCLNRCATTVRCWAWALCLLCFGLFTQ